MPIDNKYAWWRRRSFRVVGVFDAFCIAAIIAILLIPALAQTLIPIPGTNYVIDIGQGPPWIMAIAMIVNTWMLVSVHMKAGTIAKQTDGLLDKVAAMSKSSGKMEERIEAAAAKELVRTDAVADAKSKAEVTAIKADDPTIPPVRP